MIAESRDTHYEARDAALERTVQWVRITRLVPLCPQCQNAMGRVGEGAGRKRYYKCKACGVHASGTTTRENL